ncbi:MAG: HAMP domain-containing histidine kinase [Candidatus Marinimicrobia bacterium]|nr:HAMP domain-containing histidine kinase [Candidatus Neomarinimicrobiota bacterium]MCF7922225.1 HAMP domain-containing histidine kinase [Candidatus Neomarinimicrobiota bacterium]
MREFRSTTNIKLGLFVLSILIISGSLLYTNWLVRELRDDNLRFLNFNSKLLANALSADLQSKAYQDEQRQFLNYNANLYARALSADSPSMDFAFNQIIRNLSFPVIITVVESGEQIIYAYRNLTVPDSLDEDSLAAYLHRAVAAMDEQNQAIPVKYQGQEIMEIHFGRVEPREFEAIVENIMRAVNFPMILTQKNGLGKTEIKDHTLELDASLSSDERINILQTALRRMDAINDPVPVEFGNETVMLIHYEDSGLIQALRWFPFIEFGIMGGFILLGFAGFQFIRKAEHRGIWVGLSKETAHQLGTPLSSLMGWIELLRQEENNSQTAQIVEEMDHDLQRLNQVAERFSKIGAGVKLVNLSIKDLVEPVLGYVQRRIPQWGKTIQIEFDCPEDYLVLAHAELFGWAIENLLKNSVDAIKGDEGSIQVRVLRRNNWVQIRVRDNGEGIPLRDHKNIFRPGWSSKKRGWGLGLSLVERIIREYHQGHITVESAPGQGTTFEISLKTTASD